MATYYRTTNRVPGVVHKAECYFTRVRGNESYIDRASLSTADHRFDSCRDSYHFEAVPEKKHILLYKRTREPPGDVESDPVNKMSTLLLTVPDRTVGKGAVVMTGDSVGRLTLPIVHGQHLPVYRIQHHGNKRNSQIGTSGLGVGADVERVCKLCMILDIYLKQGLTSSGLLHGVPDGAIYFIAIQAQTTAKLMARQLSQYFNALITRRAAFLNAIHDGTILATLQPADGGEWSSKWMKPSGLMSQVETEWNNVPVGVPSWALFSKPPWVRIASNMKSWNGHLWRGVQRPH